VEPTPSGDPRIDKPASIPRSRPEPSEALEGEVIPKGVPIGRPVDAQPRSAPPAPPTTRVRPWKTVLVLLAVIAGVLCLGGLGAGYLLYNKATEPDRSTPGVALRRYLSAVFDDRDTSKAARFTCANPEAIATVQQLRTDVEDKERQFSVHIDVRPENIEATESGGSATVKAQLRLSVSVDATSQEQLQQWQFTLSRRDGWRVCDARRID
jgi:hypothetical protein